NKNTVNYSKYEILIIKYVENQLGATAFNFLRNTDTTQNDTEDTESAYGGWLEIDEEDLE
ncbi:TPA: hypothetical protein J1421_003719, partial [Escherichia coli]|nr:hypothetical protein [Escherichia coli]